MSSSSMCAWHIVDAPFLFVTGMNRKRIHQRCLSLVFLRERGPSRSQHLVNMQTMVTCFIKTGDTKIGVLYSAV